MIGEAMRARLTAPHAPVEVASEDAPVHEVVQLGPSADLTSLPVHLQHALDGAPYISASIDFARDKATGWTNVGCRRIMLRTPDDGRHRSQCSERSASDVRRRHGAR